MFYKKAGACQQNTSCVAVDTHSPAVSFSCCHVHRVLLHTSHITTHATWRAHHTHVLCAGALTCTKPGAIAAQPDLSQVQKLFDESKSWYNFW